MCLPRANPHTTGKMGTKEKVAGQQFSIKYLFLATFTVALLLAFVAQEPFGIGMAAFFCVGSLGGILCLSFITIRNLVDVVVSSIQSRRFGVLTTRYRWVYLDIFIATWLVFTIVISNFVLANSIAHARNLVLTSWAFCAVGFVAMVFYIVVNRRRENSNPNL